MMTICIRLEGMKIESLNRSYRGASRGARMASSAKVGSIRDTVRAHVLAACGIGMGPRLRAVRLVRISAGKLDDDNLVGSCKAALDGVARALGLNDRTFVIVGDRPGVRVTPSQRSEGRGRFAVELDLDFDDSRADAVSPQGVACR